MDVLVTAAFAFLLGGILLRMTVFLRRPQGRGVQPGLPIRGGRLGLVEALLFRRLWRDAPSLWLASMAFHGGLAALLLAHLNIAPHLLRAPGAAAMIGGLAWLLGRRLVLPAMRRISAPSDFLLLLLLLANALSGAAFLWLVPGEMSLLVHQGLGIVLFLVLPFSKLLHAPGIVLSPSRRVLHD
ncbi:hypothetical protein [Telmatospirillum sp. J64-1]|uniref:hypothetical protein n=1 Tax=Telmatospirillum sp. J64-1 TaxID=2502183 RepID=UPI00115C77FB|nr:hypothetical protein [Telmatospirillum sp. J64-1]